MSQGSKAKYTAKQKRQAEHIEDSYRARGASKKTAEKRAWQTVNKQSGGGEKSGGGTKVPAKAKQEARSESGKRAALSRKVGSKTVQKTPPKKQASKARTKPAAKKPVAKKPAAKSGNTAKRKQPGQRK